MSNDNEQESDNELKVTGKIELKFKNKKLTGDDVVHAQNLYKILDKLVMDLNKAKLDNVLDKSINQLNNALAEEKSRLDELVVKVGDETGGLIKKFEDLKVMIQTLEEERISEDVWG